VSTHARGIWVCARLGWSGWGYISKTEKEGIFCERNRNKWISPVPMRLSYLGIDIHKKCACVFRLSESNVRNGVHALFWLFWEIKPKGEERIYESLDLHPKIKRVFCLEKLCGTKFLKMHYKRGLIIWNETLRTRPLRRTRKTETLNHGQLSSRRLSNCHLDHSNTLHRSLNIILWRKTLWRGNIYFKS
jgi:hypothetical protein